MVPLAIWSHFESLKDPRVERTRRHERLPVAGKVRPSRMHTPLRQQRRTAYLQHRPLPLPFPWPRQGLPPKPRLLPSQRPRREQPQLQLPLRCRGPGCRCPEFPQIKLRLPWGKRAPGVTSGPFLCQ